MPALMSAMRRIWGVVGTHVFFSSKSRSQVGMSSPEWLSSMCVELVTARTWNSVPKRPYSMSDWLSSTSRSARDTRPVPTMPTLITCSKQHHPTNQKQAGG